MNAMLPVDHGAPAQAVLHEIARLWSADPPIARLLGSPLRLYDHPPERAIYPFLRLARAEILPNHADQARSELHSFSLHLWSRAMGRDEVARILARLSLVLDETAFPLALGAATLIHVYVLQSEIFHAEDGRQVRGVLRLRAVLELPAISNSNLP